MMQENDPFASVRLNPLKAGPSIQVQDTMQESPSDKESDPFEDVRIKEAKGFPGIKEVGRNATRLASRIVETVGGIPGDIQSLLESGLFAGFEFLTGKQLPEEFHTRKFPTSGELKEKSQKTFGEYVKPQSATEKTLDDYTEKVASLLGPMKFRRALGIALGSQTAKEGIKLLGLGEGAQAAGDIGTMFFLSALNPGGAMKFSSSQFEKANQLAKGASVQATNLESNVKNLLSDLSKGVPTTSKNSVMKPAEELLKKINKGKIDVQDLTAAKRDISSIMGEPETLKGAKKLLKVLGKEVDQAIKPFEKIRPDFAKAYRPANEIFGAVMEGSKASNFMKKTLGTKSVIGATLAEIALGHPEAIIPTFGLAVGGIGAASTLDFLTRLSKSPELRKYYNKVLLAAAKEDAGQVRTYADKIEHLLEKD